MTIFYWLRPPSGGSINATSDELAAYLALGYTQLGPPFIELPDDDPAWDARPFYNIEHADGRRYAVTYANFLRYYQPLDFYIVDGEALNGPLWAVLTDDLGVPLTDDAGTVLQGV